MPQDRTLKAIKSRSRSEQVSVVSLLLLPLLTLAAVAFLPIDPLIRSILVLGISFSTATTAPMLAERVRL